MCQKINDIKRKDFPELIEAIAEAIGEDAALTLFIRFNGRHLCVPLNCPSGHLIEQTIGKEKAKQFCQVFAGENLDFPRGAFVLKRIRNENIKKDLQAGMSRADAATKYDLTERQIYKIISA